LCSDEDDNANIPLKYLSEPMKTPGIPAKVPGVDYVATPATALRWADSKHRFACPSLKPKTTCASDENAIMVSVDYATSNINAADEVREMTVALDSGAVDHVLATDDLPSTAEICELTGARVGKSFVAANGQPMQTFGECILECEDSSGALSAASFAVTEVSRPLQSVSRICDQDLEVLFTRTEAKIRDPRTGRFLATYQRRGGLYTRTVKVRAGKKPESGGKTKAPFTRQSTKR